MEENQNFSKDNNTENILTENTENTQTEAKADKHLLTLHLSHKNGSKTLHLKKGHLIAASVAALIVLGGGVSMAGEYLLDAVRAAVKPLVFFKTLPYPSIQLARLGADAGIIGAALLGRA